MNPKQTRIKPIRVPYSVVLPLFFAGLSTRQIAERIDLSSSRTHKMLSLIGLGRTKSDAATLRQPPTSKHWRSCRQQARKVWARINGSIPQGHHIHHRDGDYTNNALNNLECISAGDHIRRHWEQGDIPTKFGYGDPRPPYKRPYKIAYMAEYNRTKKKQPAVCSMCGSAFLQDKYLLHPTCSRSCGAKAFWKRRRASS